MFSHSDSPTTRMDSSQKSSSGILVWKEVDPVSGARHTWILDTEDEVDDTIFFTDD